jgi:hypothetical protein
MVPAKVPSKQIYHSRLAGKDTQCGGDDNADNESEMGNLERE